MKITVSNKGFSIIEMSISAAIMSAVALGVSTLIGHQSNSISYMEDRLSHQMFKKEINELLDQPEICKNSLQGLRAPALGLTLGSGISINDKNGDAIYNTGAKNIVDGIKIVSINLTNLDLDNVATLGNGLLQIRVERNDKSKMAMQVIEKRVPLIVDAVTRAILDCPAAGGASGLGVDQTWQDLTASRSNNVVYQNTTGKPIMLSLAFRDGGQLEVSQNGVTGWIVISDQNYRPAYTQSLIPPNQYYRATGRRNGQWIELR